MHAVIGRGREGTEDSGLGWSFSRSSIMSGCNLKLLRKVQQQTEEVTAFKDELALLDEMDGA